VKITSAVIETRICFAKSDFSKRGDGDLGDPCQDTYRNCQDPFVCSYSRCDRFSLIPFLFPVCFSGNNIVEVQDRGRISMDALGIGDLVLTSNEVFAEVYSFEHYHQKADTEFLQIQASSMYQNQALEITENHLLYVRNGNRNTQIVPAGMVKVGDFLITESGEATPITSIQKVQRRGAYAPLTMTGKIVVNGVLASNYVSRAWLQGHVSGQTLHWLQHGAALPYCFFCSLAGCENENYDELTGFSPWVMFWYNLEQWQLCAGGIVQAIFLLASTMPIIFLILLGKFVSTPATSTLAYVSMAALGCYVWAHTNKVHYKNKKSHTKV